MTEQDDIPSVYADGEIKMMLRSQAIREKLFMPLLKILDRSKVTPNHLTILSLLCGAASAFMLGDDNLTAIILLFLHVLLDGLDGPYARHYRLRSKFGETFDVVSDQATVIMNAMALIAIGAVSAVNGLAYIILYTGMVVLAYFRNKLKIPYRFLIRPRFLVYLWLIVEFYIFPNTIGYALLLLNGILLIHVLTGLYKLAVYK